MKVIILAAGYGSRMYPLAQDMPKCLLPISKGQSILDRQIGILKGFDIGDITVVTGFKKEKIIEKYGEQISIRFNPHYEITGNTFSLWTVRDIFNDDLIILNGDIIFNKKAVEDLLKDKNIYSLVVNKKKCDGEDQKVRVKDNLITEVGKHIALNEAYGEAVGMGKIKKAGIGNFKKALFEGVKKNPHLNWPEIFNYLIKKDKKVYPVLSPGLYRDLDTKRDYAEARKIFKNNESNFK